jgi:hypothetical protein
MAKRDFSSIATGFISSTASSALSLGITTADPSLSVTVPVTSVVRKWKGFAIFNPADFRDRATYENPHRYPTGTRTSVILSGTGGRGECDPHRGAARPGPAVRSGGAG